MFRRLRDIAKLVGVSAALAAGVGALAMAAPAWAQQAAATPTPAAASQALQTAQQALDPEQPPTAAELPGPDPSVALNGLAAAYSELGDRARRVARGLLARPTDGSADRFGDGYPTAAPIATAASPHFCFYWVSDRGYPDAPDLADQNGISDGDGIPDYVEALIGIAEHSYSVEVAPGPLGWAPPKPDTEGCGSDPAARSDIYLKQIGTEGLFGYESPDPGQGRSRSQYGYLVLDDDYAPEEFPGFANPTIPASVTFAHEFNHLLQQNYDSFQDLWMFESTAVWAEQKVFPQIDDFVNYVRAFAQFPGAPLTSTYPPDRRKSLKIYGSAVFNHWLDSGGGGYGADVIRGAWELSDQTKPPDLLARRLRPRDRGRRRAELQPRVRLVRRGDGGVADGPGELPGSRRVPRRQAQAFPASLDARRASPSSTRPTGSSRSSPGRRRASCGCGSTPNAEYGPPSGWSAGTAARWTAG